MMLKRMNAFQNVLSLLSRRRRRARSHLVRAALVALPASVLWCAPGQNPALASQFVIVTADGEVLADVHGSANGVSNARLARLIQAGVANRYPIRCDAATDGGSWRTRLDWRVADDGKKPTATITAQLVRDGQTVAALATKAIAPKAAPDAAFASDVSMMTQKILPPPVADAPQARICTGKG
jgi:hypothetical protein